MIKVLMFFFAVILGISRPAIAKDMNNVEIRRTFASDACDSGEIYINHEREFLFMAPHGLWEKLPPPGRVNIAKISNKKIATSYFPNSEQSLSINDENGNAIISLILLNTSSFSQFVKRKLIYSPPASSIYLGYSLSNRNCTVTADSNEALFNDKDILNLDSSSDRAGKYIFGIDKLQDNFDTTHVMDAILIFSDKSKGFSVRSDFEYYSAQFPPRLAGNVEKDDPCLSKIEHMGNTIHYKDKVVYERRDDVVVCTNGTSELQGIKFPLIEVRRDIRFIMVRQSEICATVLGIPIGTSWYFYFDQYGSGFKIGTECTGGSYSESERRINIEFN